MTRTKGAILHVGEWDDERNKPVGWVFSGAHIGLQLFTDGRAPLISGYTTDELRAIYEAKCDVRPVPKAKP